MKDLAPLSTQSLEAMKARLTNWIVYIAALDVVVVAVFVWLLMTRPPMKIVPLLPIFLLPAIAMMPFLVRVGAIRRELKRRAM